MSEVQRQVLPIADARHIGVTTFDATDPDTAYPPIEPLRPPAGAPNVLVVLLDDVGFGASSAFGGPCATPTAERLAGQGLQFTRFHWTPARPRIDRTHGFFFSMDETTDIGRDAGAPVSDDYGPRGNDFTGQVAWVQIDLDAAAEDLDHLVSSEERFHLAMAKQ